PAFGEDERRRQDEALRATNIAQPGLGAVGLGGLHVLAHFGIWADAVAGHSYGELVALCAAGRIDTPALHRLSRMRGRLMADGSGDRGAMLAVQAAIDVVENVLSEERLQVVI